MARHVGKGLERRTFTTRMLWAWLKDDDEEVESLVVRVDVLKGSSTVAGERL